MGFETGRSQPSVSNRGVTDDTNSSIHSRRFTPLFHISALLGSPKAMTTSIAEATVGNRLWFAAGPAFVGLMIHMVTGAVCGMGFMGALEQRAVGWRSR